MASQKKPHLRIDNFSKPEDYASRHQGRSMVVPTQSDRFGHGSKLLAQYNSALTFYQSKRKNIDQSITEETGLYLEITGFPGEKLPLETLDTVRYYRLQSLHITETGAEVAVIFVPDSRRLSLADKLTNYLNPDKDTAKSKKPRNQKLVDSISHIRLANIRSFWTDPQEFFPRDTTEKYWWELWLSKQSGIDLKKVTEDFAHRIEAQLGNCAITFFNSFVVLIKASQQQLEQATELLSCLSELRAVRENSALFIHESSASQREWANDLIARIKINENTNVFVSILDTGVNYDHPILSIATDASLAQTWSPSWPNYTSSHSNKWQHHGSEQAGLALFGDNFYNALTSTQITQLTHKIESGRILPPAGENDPLLYGAITADISLKLESAQPSGKRIFSMAITAPHENQGGSPSSWSSKIDAMCAGAEDTTRRLYVLSAGNNRDLDPNVEFWDQAHLEEIEDPAQAWNAITVGAFTEKTTVDDLSLDGWSPLASQGDLCPRSRTSVNWAWKKHSPFKPDVVAEGGNVLLSPNQSEISDADCVSLLTTSGRATGQLFSTTGATSAATAIVSHQAAILTAENPLYWPETIRALLVHSANWTRKMHERSRQLEKQYAPKAALETMLRTVGFGVPNLERARASAQNHLTLISQNSIQPYTKKESTPSQDPVLKEMHLYQLPWPKKVLESINSNIELRLKITLSYFIEPNPSRRGYRNRFSYASHGLRFGVIRPTQSLGNFRASINQLANDEDYHGIEGTPDGWKFGEKLRKRGSIHSDIWTGSAADLALMNTIAIYPVSGWWKSRISEKRWNSKARYSLIVSIESPDQSIDLYSEVENIIKSEIEINV